MPVIGLDPTAAVTVVVSSEGNVTRHKDRAAPMLGYRGSSSRLKLRASDHFPLRVRGNSAQQRLPAQVPQRVSELPETDVGLFARG